MATSAIPLDVKSAEERLMRFLSVEGVTGQEAKIAAAVRDELKKIGVPANAIRFDNVKKRIPVPTETGNLIAELPGTQRGHGCCSRHILIRFHCALARSRNERAIGFSPTVRPRSGATIAQGVQSL